MEGRTGSLSCSIPSPCPITSYPTLPVCRISCLPGFQGLPDTHLLCFLFSLSLMLKAVPCNYLIFPSFCQEIPEAEFPWDARWQARCSTLSVHPAWSCSQLGRGDGAGAIKAGGGSVPLYAAAQPISLYCSSQEPQAGTILGLKTPKKSSQCSRLGLYLMLQRPCYL